MRITNALDLPQPFVSAVSSEYAYAPKRYSVTSVLKGTREAILQRRHDDEIESDVADMAWLIFGSAVHSILENSAETDTQLKENKLTVEVGNGYTLSGIFDLYDDATGTVTDYKTASTWKVTFNDWDDYRMQTLLYCYMLREIGFDARRGEVVALLKDHSKTKAEVDGSYPRFPIYRIGWDFSGGDFEEAEAFLSAKFAEIERAEKLPDCDLPLCSDEERWHRPDKWAIKKKGNKRAHRLYESEGEARANAEALGMVIEFRPGEDAKCAKYCSACDFCDYGKALKGGDGE